MQYDGGNKKVVMAHILAASFSAVVATAVVLYRKRRSSLTVRDRTVTPWLDRSESGRARKIEKFSHYVARQMGFGDASECPQLCKLAHKYLRKTKGCEESIYAFFSGETEAESLYVNLIQELDRCILSYFAFHWTHASDFITQVLSEETEKKTKLKGAVMAATRKQRFERVSKNLKVTRVIATLVEEMKVIGSNSFNGDDSHCTEVMAPVAHSDRSPVLLLMGGGMGAGKSTVLEDIILKESFWFGAKAKAVRVEADAFKESDVIYKAISSMGHHDDILETSELVHQTSTDAASSLLVTALNEGRDVIMDGTLSWEPFVEQMVSMTRNIHRQRYRMGVGYKVAEDGTITETYWEVEKDQVGNRKPYRIELVGVVCDAYLAVVRGIRRAIITGRAVRVNPQLKSHKRFAHAFLRYCQLVDNARLFCTNGVGIPPKLMAWKDGDNSLLVDPEEINHLKLVSSLNARAESIYEVYPQPSPIDSPGSVWNDIVMSPSRPSIQQHLKAFISKIEHSALPTLS